MIREHNGLKISDEKPLNYDRIAEAFGDRWDSGLIVTYGDTAHVKGGVGLTKDLIVHEKVHVKQQTEYGVDAWWERYFTDKEFRLQQEKEAYGAQIRCIRDSVSNPKKQRARMENIVSSMVDAYGEMITREDAVQFAFSMWVK